MTADLAILVPALSRPHNVTPLLDSVEATAPGATTLFICDHGDAEQIAAVETDGRATLDISGGNYAQKINRGIEITAAPLIFCGADDLRFEEGWLEAARELLDRAEVVGVNDLIPRSRDHQTHFLVSREYARGPQIDGEPWLMCEQYAHCCVDDELIATARHRGVYGYAIKSRVRHLHPMVGAPNDAVYVRGMSHIRADRRLFAQRRPLWT